HAAGASRSGAADGISEPAVSQSVSMKRSQARCDSCSAWRAAGESGTSAALSAAAAASFAAASAESAQTIRSRTLAGLAQSTGAACAPAPSASSAARVAAKSGAMPALTPGVSLADPLRRLLDEAEIGVFLGIEIGFQEAQIMRRGDVALQRVEIGHALRVVIEIALGEEPSRPQRGRGLGVGGHVLDRLVVIGRIPIPAQLAQIVLEEIDQRSAVLLNERRARGHDDHLRDAERVL